MAQESYTLWDEMKALDNNNAIYTSCGLLWLGDRKETLERAGYLEKCNADYEILSGKEIRKKFPYLNYDSEEEDWHAVLDKKGGVIHAERALQSAQRLFKKFGGEIKEHAKVIEVIPGSVVKIKLLDGTVYETKQLIVTVGAWLTALMPEIKVASVPKLVSVNFWKLKDEYKDKEHYFEPDNMSPCLIITKGEEELFMIPGADYKGQVKFGIHAGETFDVDNDKRIIPDWMHLVPGKHIRKHIQYIDATKPELIVPCVYQMTEDINFILDKHPEHQNIVIGSGFSGTGFKFAVLVGQILNDLLDNKKIDSCDMSVFSATRIIPLNLKCKL
uniref:Sarcosine oxidasee (formaldehyde-forming) n=1 Tax=Rhabditophanes sp. KR3021 TaxID=114890 RepID=A0AC35UH11_9BILA